MPDRTSTISVVMIVKNEEQKLQHCLDSVTGWVDEIVILDSGSSDATLSIAKKYTSKIYQNTDWKGFGHQRRLAQSYATCDWILVLDADEQVTETLRSEILKVVKTSHLNVCYKVNRLSKAFGKYIKFSGWSPDWIVRLYPRELTQYNDALVHEKVIVPKDITINKIKNGYLLHDTYENVHHYIEKTTGYIKAWSDQREGRKYPSLATALFHAWGCFVRMYIFKLGFLDGKHGFILAWLGMHSTFVKYIDLWLRNYRGNDE
ncbi:glycosyltransferase family 2 protein [Marinomonas agarivorans]|nr:glycosyltransferase family 2 protein [Marinomonas agarivorans]